MKYLRGMLILAWMICGIWGVAAQDVTCSGVPLARLVIGNEGRVLPGEANNVRSLPSLNAEKVGKIPGGETFHVVEGPVCADGLNWWQVDYNGMVGWTVEGQGADYWVEPLAPVQAGAVATSAVSAPPTIPTFLFVPPLPAINQLSVGVQARIIEDKTRDHSLAPSLRMLYEQPTVNSASITPLEIDTLVTVVGGPQNADGYRWWQVQTQSGIQGWAVEGTNLLRQLLPACPKTENRIVYTIDLYLYTADVDGSNRCVFDLLQVLYWPMWSADRQKVLFFNYRNGDYFYAFVSVYQISIDGRQRMILVDDRRAVSLDYSPDGQRLLSVEEANDSVEVWVQSPDTPESEKTLITTVTSRTGWAGWLDDDMFLLWDGQNYNPSGSVFYTYSLSQRTMTQLFTTSLVIYNADSVQTGHVITLSPDRSKVALTGHAPDNDLTQTLVFDTHTGEQIVRFSNAYLNVWSPDGTQLLTLREDDVKKASVQPDARPVIIPFIQPPIDRDHYGDVSLIEWLADDVVRYISRDTIYHINPITGEVTQPAGDSEADG